MITGLIMAAAFAVTTPDPPEFAEYRQCVMDAAAEFEASGESASVVTDAAMAQCLPQRYAIFKKDGPFSDEARSVEEQIVGAFETQIRDAALVSVVRKRMARHRSHP